MFLENKTGVKGHYMYERIPVSTRNYPLKISDFHAPIALHGCDYN